MQTNEQLLSVIENYLAQTELPAEPELLYAPIGYSLSGGGKRLRPMLVMLSCGIFSDDALQALPAAAAVEMFHNFTLLHDDIMDNAAVRRGKPSVFARWGQNVAILSGDAMMISSYRLLSGVPPRLLPQILATFNEMALEVCEGQQYDMDFELKSKVSVVDYMHMIELKTSALLSGAVAIGAMLGGASEEDCRKLRRFALELGLAFQLQDDLLDSYGDEELGKAIGGDILEGKKTYLMVTAMSRADESTREVLRRTYRDERLTNAEKIAAVKRIYDRLDVRHLTEQQISLRFDRALAADARIRRKPGGPEEITERSGPDKTHGGSRQKRPGAEAGRETGRKYGPKRPDNRKTIRKIETFRHRDHGPRGVVRIARRSHSGRSRRRLFRRGETQHAFGFGGQLLARRPGADRRHGPCRGGKKLPDGEHRRL